MNKKGFTLIELLAVIVILAIIALIATPIVLNIISETKSSASLRSGEFYLDAIEQSIAKEMLDGTQVESGTYSIMKDGKLCIEMKHDYTCDNGIDVEVNGQTPDNGFVKIEGGKVIYSKMVFDGNILVNREGTLTVYDESSNDGTPRLVLKTENGVIDNGNNFVYSFYNGDEGLYNNLDLSEYFEAKNGSLEYKKNSDYFYSHDVIIEGEEFYSTGAEIILKDTNGKIVDTYTVIIFGDFNGDAVINSSDSSEARDSSALNRIEMKAADVNQDGKITDEDYEMIENQDGFICRYDQIKRICIEI